MKSIVADVLGVVLGNGILAAIALPYLQGLIAQVQGPLISDIDKLILNMTPQEKASLQGVLLILKQEFPAVVQGGSTALVAALIAKYPALAPLQPTLNSFLSAVEGEVIKDVAAPVVATK